MKKNKLSKLTTKTKIMIFIGIILAIILFFIYNHFSGRELTGEECKERFIHYVESRGGDANILNDDNSGYGKITYFEKTNYDPTTTYRYQHFSTEDEAKAYYDSLYDATESTKDYTVNDYNAGDEAFVKVYERVLDKGSPNEEKYTFYSVHFRHGKNVFACTYSTYDNVAYINDFICVMTNDF